MAIFCLSRLITILAGGTGSIKLVRGFASLVRDLTIISNVGDNIWLYGLYICPDIDTITYGLARVLDEKRGWGIKGDTFDCLARLRRLGSPTWFALGDQDLATHLFRTSMIKQGKSLSEITHLIRRRFSVAAKIVPATDDEVSTFVTTPKGKMHLQEFWVKLKGNPHVNDVSFNGARKAVATPEAINAIRRSRMIILAPANPVSSIAPMLSIKEIATELAKLRCKVVAVSPLVGNRAISGPAVKYMKALGLEISPLGIARYYRKFVGNFIVSESDRRLTPRINALGMRVFGTNILMKTSQDEIRLARHLIQRFKIK